MNVRESRPPGTDVAVRNPGEIIYIKGSESVDGSIRLQVIVMNGGFITEIQTRTEGIWQPTSFKTGAESVLVGTLVRLSAAGNHLITNDGFGHVHFNARSELEDGVSTSLATMINATSFTERAVFRSDESSTFTGTLIENLVIGTALHLITGKFYFKTGATAASEAVRVEAWKGIDDTGSKIFDQLYPPSEFPANTEIGLTLEGFLEFFVGDDTFTRITSDADFSLKTNAALDAWWLAVDFSAVSDDDLLQTTEWVDGNTFTEGDWSTQDRKVYVCNVTGIQTGTFNDNLDKWDVLTPNPPLPEITSSLTLEIEQTESLDYELTADFGVGFEWDDLPLGVFARNGNVRKIFGGGLLLPAVYELIMRSRNITGTTEETLTLTVTALPWEDDFAVQFNVLDYMDASADTSNPLYRAANGTGANDAWTIAFWFEGGSSSNGEQTVISFGGSSQSDEGRVQVYWDGNNDRMFLQYGTNNDYLRMNTDDSTVPDGTYTHIIMAYDGGATDNEQYSSFKVFIDGVGVSWKDENESNKGFGGEIVDDFFRMGRNLSAGNYLQGSTLLDEVALWDSDQSANVAAIYNGGVTHDLRIMANPPEHYWAMGDLTDVFPIIFDHIGSLNMTMTNMVAGDIVADTP